MLRFIARGLAVVFLVTLLAMSLWTARADQPQSKGTEVARGDTESVQVRLARAHVALARLDLRRVLDANERGQGVYSTEYVDKLRLHVAIDEAELQQCLKGEDKDPHQVCIRGAEAAVRIAEADLNGARAVQQRMSSNSNALVAERAEIVERIASLNLERMKQLEDSESALAHLQAQIDQLRHQVLELQLRR